MTAVSETPRIGYAPEEIVTGEPTRSARYKWAVVVEVGGLAHFTGESRFRFDDDDPLREGFIL